MTKEYSLIKDGKVVNRIVADADFIEKIRGDYDLITDDPQAAKGATWDGKVFTPPVAKEVPETPPSKTVEDVLTKLAELEVMVKAVDSKLTAKIDRVIGSAMGYSSITKSP